MAARNGDADLLQDLLSFEEVDASANQNYALMKAGEYGFSEIVQILLRQPTVHPESQNRSAFRFAIQGGHLDTVKVFMADQRLRVQPVDMRSASRFGYLDIMLVLQAKVGFHDFMLYDACKQGHIHIVNHYLESAALSPTVDVLIKTCLLLSMRATETTVMERLLAEPLDRLFQCGDILPEAVRFGPRWVRLLLDHPVITRESFEEAPMSRSPLTVAAEHSGPWGTEVLEMLLNDQRVCVETSAALIHAAMRGNLPHVKVLLADDRLPPDAAKMIFGHSRTALEMAASQGHVSCARALLADTRVVARGSALQLAVLSRNVEIVRMLLGKLRPDQCIDAAVEAVVDWWEIWVMVHGRQLVARSAPAAQTLEEDVAAVRCAVKAQFGSYCSPFPLRQMFFAYRALVEKRNALENAMLIMEKCFQVPETKCEGVEHLGTRQSDMLVKFVQTEDQGDVEHQVQQEALGGMGGNDEPGQVVAQDPRPLQVNRRQSGLIVSDTKHILFQTVRPVVLVFAEYYEKPLRLEGILLCAKQAGELGFPIPGGVLLELMCDWCSPIYEPHPRTMMTLDDVVERIGQIVGI